MFSLTNYTFKIITFHGFTFFSLPSLYSVCVFLFKSNPVTFLRRKFGSEEKAAKFISYFESATQAKEYFETFENPEQIIEFISAFKNVSEASRFKPLNNIGLSGNQIKELLRNIPDITSVDVICDTNSMETMTSIFSAVKHNKRLLLAFKKGDVSMIFI